MVSLILFVRSVKAVLYNFHSQATSNLGAISSNEVALALLNRLVQKSQSTMFCTTQQLSINFSLSTMQLVFIFSTVHTNRMLIITKFSASLRDGHLQKTARAETFVKNKKKSFHK